MENNSHGFPPLTSFAEGLRTSFDDIPRPKLAKLPRLKLGREGALVGEAVKSPLGLPGGEASDGRLAFSASESRYSTNKFEKDSSPVVLAA